MHVCVYIYIYRERERELYRDRGLRGRVGERHLTDPRACGCPANPKMLLLAFNIEIQTRIC